MGEEASFEKKIREPRFQWIDSYTTPVEVSRAAADYLIAHAGAPLNFDKIHKKLGIQMDNGGVVFPYVNLNWHTWLWLDHLGYDYKLFCVETPAGESLLYPKNPDPIKYILVEKKEKMVWGNTMEKEKRSFNSEFPIYYGALYNSKFELVKDSKSIDGK